MDEKGGFALDEEKGGFALDTKKAGEKGGFALDTGVETIEKKGGFALDREEQNISNANFDEYNKKKKVYGCFSYEAGRIIGINETDSKIYVQFEDTAENYCHIFKAGIPSDRFDIIDKYIQALGK